MLVLKYHNKEGSIMKGIPYFGEYTQLIEERIKSLEVYDTVKYDSLYELIQSEKSADKIIVVEDSNGVWLTYIRDIKFNYRDKEAYIPYYTYRLYELDEEYRHKYKGHILKTDTGISIRYDYKLSKV